MYRPHRTGPARIGERVKWLRRLFDPELADRRCVCHSSNRTMVRPYRLRHLHNVGPARSSSPAAHAGVSAAQPIGLTRVCPPLAAVSVNTFPTLGCRQRLATTVDSGTGGARGVRTYGRVIAVSGGLAAGTWGDAVWRLSLVYSEYRSQSQCVNPLGNRVTAR